jgi:hypothetical protein
MKRFTKDILNNFLKHRLNLALIVNRTVEAN